MRTSTFTVNEGAWLKISRALCARIVQPPPPPGTQSRPTAGTNPTAPHNHVSHQPAGPGTESAPAQVAHDTV